MNRVEIEVKGACGAGKSSIAALIQQVLEASGFTDIKTNVVDDVHPNKLMAWVQKNPARIESIRDSTKIVIKEKQMSLREARGI